MSEAAILERLADMDAKLARIMRMLDRAGEPVARLTFAEAARRMAVSTRTLARYCSRGVFSDARPKSGRGKGARRMIFSDELQLFNLEGAAAVRRFRKEVGRD